MTKLLISVRDAAEAAMARQFPIDIIDIKDPALGALGAVDDDQLNDILEELENFPVKSLALGELQDWIIHQSINQPSRVPPFSCMDSSGGFNSNLTRFRYAKIGLAGIARTPRWQEKWLAWSATLPPDATPVGVAYVDHQVCDCPPLEEVLQLVLTQTDPVLLLDTFDKKSGSVLSLVGEDKLKSLIQAARRQHVMTVVAGSVQLQHLSELFSCQPDVIGVRGAVCATGRLKMDRERLVRFVDAFGHALIDRGNQRPAIGL